MIIEKHSAGSFEIKPGVKTTIDFKRPYRYVIETTGGSVFEGAGIPNSPLEITAGSDIKDIKIFIEDAKPLHLIK